MLRRIKTPLTFAVRSEEDGKCEGVDIEKKLLRILRGIKKCDIFAARYVGSGICKRKI